MRFLYFFILIFFIGCATDTKKSVNFPAEKTVITTQTVTIKEPVVTIPAKVVTTPSKIESIKAIVSGSTCSKYSWQNRGRASLGYITGVSLVFAKAVCNYDTFLAGAKTSNEKSDALAWYSAIFNDLKMSNDVTGNDTLRHVYTLLMGLGMRESSGNPSCGRDLSANFNTADSAEAGLFQASWGAHRTSSLLEPMFLKYKASKEVCLKDIFYKGISIKQSDVKNWGFGDGYEWQKLTKECPAFATEYAAVLLRSHGGSKGEFGPIRTHRAEVRSECDSMLMEVQKFVGNNSDICSQL